MDALQTSPTAFAAALGIGLLVGLERERNKGNGDDRASAGLRTFAVTAMLGHVSLLLGGVPLLIAALLGLTLLLAAAYPRGPGADPGLTTEIALLLVLALGALTLRAPSLAAALGVVLTVLLAYRDSLHRFVLTQLSAQELRDGLTLATAALVILPLVPDRYLGPYDAVNPRTIWLLSVLIMTISACGHVAIRIVGPRYGLPLAGLVSGFASSTATLATMGGRARSEPALLAAAASAGVLSCVATMAQMGLILAALDLATAWRLAPALTAAGLVALACGAWGLRADGHRAEAAPVSVGRAFDLRLALSLGLTVGLIQLVSALCYHWFGNRGVLASAAIAGLADTHAAGASVAALVRSGTLSADAAVLPVLAAMTTNTVSKAAVAMISGGRAYALRVIPGLVLVLATLWATHALA